MKVNPFFVIFFLLLAKTKSQEHKPCPPAIEVLPCQCHDLPNGLLMQCNNIKDESDLERAFSASFQENNIYQLNIEDGTLTSLTKNVFGSIAFENVYIFTSAIKSIADTVFENSKTSLQTFYFNDIQLTDDSFAFEKLDDYTALYNILINGTSITKIPLVKSDSLAYLILTYMPIEVMSANSFSGVPNLWSFNLNNSPLKVVEKDVFLGADNLSYMELIGNSIISLDSSTFDHLDNVVAIDLSNNKLSELTLDEGIFSGFSSLVYLEMNNNQFQEIPSELKFLPNLESVYMDNNLLSTITPDTFSGNPKLRQIHMSGNSFKSLEEGWFKGIDKTNAEFDFSSSSISSVSPLAFSGFSGSEIRLGNNQLAVLDQEWLRPILEGNNYVSVYGNPYVCDCAFSWILDDPSFSGLIYGDCQDGTPISDLTSSYFEGC